MTLHWTTAKKMLLLLLLLLLRCIRFVVLFIEVSHGIGNLRLEITAHCTCVLFTG